MRPAHRRGKPRAAARHVRRGVRVEVLRRVRSWSPTRRDLTRWASVAAGSGASGRELGVCMVGAPESRRLNARFRGLDTPTNVLSFSSVTLAHAALEIHLQAALFRGGAPAGARLARRGAHWEPPRAS